MNLKDAGCRWTCYQLQPACDKINTWVEWEGKSQPFHYWNQFRATAETIKIGSFEKIRLEVRSQESLLIKYIKLWQTMKGNAKGRLMQIMLPPNTNIMPDLFMPEPEDYFRQFAIRTGILFFSSKGAGKTGWNKIGWCGSIGTGEKNWLCWKPASLWWKS